MHMKTYRAITAAVAAVVFVALLGSSAGHTAASTTTTFSGRATVVQGQIAGIPIGPIVDTGPVDASGGNLHESLLDYPISGVPDPLGGALTAEVLHASVVAHGNRSSAQAFVARFSLSAAGQSVSANVLSARASATCSGSTATVSGSSEVAGLTVNGQTISVSGQANQRIPLPGGEIVINEQIGGASAQNGDITVNALHIILTDPLLGTRTDLIVASAHADIACGVTDAGGCANRDFVTGGGWITKSGARATFAVAGGPGGWGHLQYIDHGSHFKAKGTGVTAYGQGTNGPTSRQIDGTAEWTGGSGTYHAEVADNGEPGRSDTFQLVLSNGYMAAGLLDGGNIQLHCK
jgi:hypothetical protein